MIDSDPNKSNPSPPEKQVIEGVVVVEGLDGTWVTPEVLTSQKIAKIRDNIGWISEIIYQGSWVTDAEHKIWDILEGDVQEIENWKEWADMSIYSSEPLVESMQLLDECRSYSYETGFWHTFDEPISLTDWRSLHNEYRERLQTNRDLAISYPNTLDSSSDSK